MSSTSSAWQSRAVRALPWLAAAAALAAFILGPVTSSGWVAWAISGLAVILTVAAAVTTSFALSDARAEVHRLAALHAEAAARDNEWAQVLDVVLGEQLPAWLTGRTAPPLPTLPPGSPTQARLDDSVTMLRRLREQRDLAVLNVVRALGRKVQASAHRIQEEAARMVQRHPTDPDILATSMRVDHASAQQARLASSLAMLSGQLPGQLWNDPLPLPDVVRAAAGRITAFRRVEVSGDPGLAVVPRAVEPLIHLVAELLANATQSSPPSTQVLAVLRQVQRGAVIEIDDGGVGLDPKRLADLREVASGRRVIGLADLGEIPQLGLAVVGTYARRYGFKVDLSESVYGGLRVIVLVPAELTESILPPTVTAPTATVTAEAIAAALPAPAAPSSSAEVAGHDDAKPDDTWPDEPGTAPLPALPQRATSARADDVAIPELPQRRSRRAAATEPQPTTSVLGAEADDEARTAAAQALTASQTAEEAGAWMGAFFAAEAAGAADAAQAAQAAEAAAAADRDSSERPASAAGPSED